MPPVFGCEPCSRWACVMITRAQSRVFITALASDTRRWSSTGMALTRRVGAEPAGVDTAKALAVDCAFLRRGVQAGTRVVLCSRHQANGPFWQRTV